MSSKNSSIQFLSRNIQADALKSICIFGVVYIHCYGIYYEFFRFCVPVFITIFAFYFESKLLSFNNKNIWKYTINRFKLILIPYLFWTIFYLLLFHQQPSEWRSKGALTILNGWFGGYGWAGQYFFIILFQLILLFPFFHKLNRKYVIYLFIIIGVFLNLLTFYLLSENPIIQSLQNRLFIYWLPYTFLGIALARNYICIKLRLFPLALLILSMSPLEHSLYNNSHYFVYLSPINTFGSLALLLSVGPKSNISSERILENIPSFMQNFIGYIGKNTFIIYVSNELFKYIAQNIPLVLIQNIYSDFIKKTALILFVIGCSLLLGEIFRKLKLKILVL